MIKFALAAAGGLVLGLLTMVLQGVLPGAWNQLANSGAVWSAAAFAAGAYLAGQRWWRPVLAGLITLFGAVIGYYASTTIFLHDDVSASALRGPGVWLAVAVIAGPLFGFAGASYRDSRHWWRVTGMTALGAIFAAESLYYQIILGYPEEALIFAAIALALPVVLGRSAKERWQGLLALIPMTALGALAMAGVYFFAEWAFQQ